MRADEPMDAEVLPRVAAAEVGKRWRSALLSLAIVFVALFVLYRDTVMAMATIWARSDTFTHGFLVPPISLWLIWRARDRVKTILPAPCVWILPLMAGSGFLWLLGEMAHVAALSQFAFTALLVLCVPALLGIHVTKKLAFPLAFLFFAVPFGEFALPQLMEWTASATITGLRLSGIPVYREGLHFVIPSGSWSVVEACSGVRYLIASAMVGTLFAYLTYRSLKRRLIFVGVSLLVPILANWLRAYMIVVLGHVSGNTLAVGVDHLIYGWLFFGIVIMIMFWIGARWREDVDAPRATAVHEKQERPAAQAIRGTYWASVSALALVVAWPIAEWQIEAHVKPEVTAIQSIDPASGWGRQDGGLAGWIPRFENAAAYVRSTYAENDRNVGVFVAFYRNQGADRKLVTSTNVLIPNNDSFWKKIDGGSRPLTIGNRTIDIRATTLRGADGSELIVWQWYWINGHLTASDPVAKAYTALSRLFGQGDDSAVVIVYAVKEEGVASESMLEHFVAAHAPAIEKALQQVRNGAN